MSDHDFETVERLAIQMCEESRGVGHWEKHKTKRQHWRDKAMRLLDIRDQSKAPHIVHSLMQACGWRA